MWLYSLANWNATLLVQRPVSLLASSAAVVHRLASTASLPALVATHGAVGLTLAPNAIALELVVVAQELPTLLRDAVGSMAKVRDRDLGVGRNVLERHGHKVARAALDLPLARWRAGVIKVARVRIERIANVIVVETHGWHAVPVVHRLAEEALELGSRQVAPT